MQKNLSQECVLNSMEYIYIFFFCKNRREVNQGNQVSLFFYKCGTFLFLMISIGNSLIRHYRYNEIILHIKKKEFVSYIFWILVLHNLLKANP